MADNQKVRVVFEFDRKDYENGLFLIGNSDRDKDEVEKVWEAMTSEDVVLESDLFAPLGVSPQKMLAIFVAGAVVSVENKVKSK